MCKYISLKFKLFSLFLYLLKQRELIMLIIDKKHKDYYDGVVGTTGVDNSVVFERTTKEIDNWKKFPKAFQRGISWNYKNKLIQHFTYRSKGDKYIHASHFIVGFCGKLYLGFKMYYENQVSPYYKETLVDFTYDVNEFKTHFNQRWSFADFDEFVEYVKNYDCVDVHRELNTPIFIFDMNMLMKHGRDESFIINPILKEYNFYKVFDSFTAFQEIQMYISGVLGVGENPTIEVSDKDKIISRGFDYKWSFRKPPTKNKI